jgi:copper(I)-binding protein
MADGLMADIVVTPGAPGPVALAITVTDAEGALAAALAVAVTLSSPALGIEPRRYEAGAADGGWRVAGASLPLPGTWLAALDIRMSRFSLVRMETEIELPATGDRIMTIPALLAAAAAAIVLNVAPTPASEVRIGDIVLSGAFARATLPSAPVGGGFLVIANTGSTDDRLVSAQADVGRDTQLHEMAVVGDVMRMRQLADGVPVPAGSTVTLAPGGLHLMFMGLTRPLVEGESFPVTLTFEKAGSVTLDMAVTGFAARAP